MNNKGNIFFFSKEKYGCPKRRWCNHIWVLINENFSGKWESGIRSPLPKLDPSRYKPSYSLTCPIVLPMAWSWITQWDGKKVIVQFKSLVIWCIDKRLAESFGTYNTDFNVRSEVKAIFPWAAIVASVPSTTLCVFF